ncbi:MAG: NTP transferase domain-containing protein [Opitutaceae bacterium]|nr:NTP transferase domain-containing protein [Opitutaceae bacterium]
MINRSLDLVVLAAGMGSRFGGLKQVSPVGPHGELVIEYSAFDARRAGFNRLVLVIRRDIEREFREAVGRRLEERMDVRYVFQELGGLPQCWAVPAGRTKPWGTGHAVLAARDDVTGPFAVINADDFYGATAYEALAAHFAGSPPTAADYAMVGYPLRQTLSEHGAVSRGLCVTDARGRLCTITEITQIEKSGSGAQFPTERGLRQLAGDEIVSMNCWGFTPVVFGQLDGLFSEFLQRHAGDAKAEFYLPTSLDALIARNEASVTVLHSADSWFGLTFREDLPATRAAIRELLSRGLYPDRL